MRFCMESEVRTGGCLGERLMKVLLRPGNWIVIEATTATLTKQNKAHELRLYDRLGRSQE